MGFKFEVNKEKTIDSHHLRRNELGSNSRGKGLDLIPVNGSSSQRTGAFLTPLDAVLHLGLSHLDLSQILSWCWPFRILALMSGCGSLL